MRRRSLLAALLLALLGGFASSLHSSAFPHGVWAQAAKSTLNLCGGVTAYTAPGSTTTGSVTVAGITLIIAANVQPSGTEIVTGSNLCFVATLNDQNEATSLVVSPHQAATATPLPTNTSTGSTSLICGVVQSYLPPTASTDGTLTIGGTTLGIAAGTVISIALNDNVCIAATLNSAHEITSATVTPNTAAPNTPTSTPVPTSAPTVTFTPTVMPTSTIVDIPPSPTSTPTSTVRPTLTATPIATATVMATDTPTPLSLPTVVTPTPLPSPTPTSTSTAPAVPTSTATPPSTAVSGAAIAIDKVEVLRYSQGKAQDTRQFSLGDTLRFVVLYHAAQDVSPSGTVVLTAHGRSLVTIVLGGARVSGHLALSKKLTLSGTGMTGRLYAHFTLTVGSVSIRRDRALTVSQTATK